MSGDWRLIIRRTGGPEAMEREDLALPPPGPGEARVRHMAIGLNFIDTYHRSGLYPLPLPSGLGMEAAGVIEAVGPGVETAQAGDRIAYAGGAPGAYATARNMPADLLVPLPDTVSFEDAAAIMLKGLTAEMLIERCARVQPGQSVLVHAAAGGVGSLLVQWLRAIGARVIAHAGSDAKAARARALGADIALSCPFDALAEAVRAETGGRGVDAVFDGVGAASWAASLAATARRGIIASYGNASGPAPPISPLDLGRAGSLFLTRPAVFDYNVTRAERLASSGRLFELLGAGQLSVDIGAHYPLAEAAEAHRALGARETTGSTVILP